MTDSLVIQELRAWLEKTPGYFGPNHDWFETNAKDVLDKLDELEAKHAKQIYSLLWASD